MCGLVLKIPAPAEGADKNRGRRTSSCFYFLLELHAGLHCEEVFAASCPSIVVGKAIVCMGV